MLGGGGCGGHKETNYVSPGQMQSGGIGNLFLLDKKKEEGHEEKTI